jgi:hypothetical protein
VETGSNNLSKILLDFPFAAKFKRFLFIEEQ